MITAVRRRALSLGIAIALIATLLFAGSVVIAQHARADVYTAVKNWGVKSPVLIRGTNASVAPTLRNLYVNQTLGGSYSPGFHPAAYYLPAGCTGYLYVYRNGVQEGDQTHWVAGWHTLAWERANYLQVYCP